MTSVKPLSAAAEDALITFRLTHADPSSRQLNKRIHAISTNNVPVILQAKQQEETSKRDQLLELDILKYEMALKKTRMAREVQDRQEAAYNQQAEELAQACAAERQALSADRNRLLANKMQRESYEKCDELARKLVDRKYGRVELDELIGSTGSQIAHDHTRLLSYHQEISNRLSHLSSLSTTLTSILSQPKFEPERNASDKKALEAEVELARKVEEGEGGLAGMGLSGLGGLISRGPSSRAGSPVVGESKAGQGNGLGGLDPKVPSFVPALLATSSSTSRAVTPTPSTLNNITNASTSKIAPSNLPTRPQYTTTKSTSSQGPSLSQSKPLAATSHSATKSPMITPRSLPAKPNSDQSPSTRGSSSRIGSSTARPMNEPPPNRINLTVPTSNAGATPVIPQTQSQPRIQEISGGGKGDEESSQVSASTEMEDGELRGSVTGSKRSREQSEEGGGNTGKRTSGRTTRSKKQKTAEPE